jgi:small-conductance mechanosensitive channel
MKKIVILILSVLFLFASSDINNSKIDDILKNIPKNSPEYSLDLLYAKKIKTLRFKKDNISASNITNYFEYLTLFKKVLSFQKFILSSKDYFDDLNKKLSILSSLDTPTQKLEYMYYKKLIQIGQIKEQYLKDHLKKWKKILYDKIFVIKFPKKSAKENIDIYQKKIEKIDKKLESLKIDLEKWKIAENEKNITYIQNLIKNNQYIKTGLKQKIIDNYLILFFDYIKTKDKKAFKVEKKIEKLSQNDKKAYLLLLGYFEKMSFGSTELFINNIIGETKLFFEKTWGILNYPLFSIEHKDISLINFFIFTVLILAGLYIGKYYKKSIYSLKEKYDINNSTATLLANIGYYLILAVVFLSSLKSIGLNLSSLTVIAGALSVGIGFGLQNVVSNFVSGIILMFEKSIKIGDYIQLDEDTRGTVTDIRMRSLTIRTNDNIDLIVPNQNFIQNIVTNWTLNDKSRRFRIPFGVAYGTEVKTVEKVVLEAVKDMKLPHYKIGAKKPQIIFTSLGDNSINFELFVWVKDELTLRPRYTTSEFLKTIYKALNDADINIPFPQQDVYIKEFPSLKLQNDQVDNSANPPR